MKKEKNLIIRKSSKILNLVKAIHYGFNKDFDTTVQPRYNMVEYADDFGMDSLSKKEKRILKLPRNKI